MSDSSLRRSSTTSWGTSLAAGLIVLATVLAFANGLSGPFVLDDEPSITDNESIRRLWPISTPLCPPTQGQTVTGRPVLNVSLAVNYAMSGLRVSSYHVTNLAIHAAAALLLFGLLRRTFLLPAMRRPWRTMATPVALAVALLWAVHPLQTESVTYIIQRAESLVALFYLLTLYGLVRGARSVRPGGWYVLSAFACLLGMGTKEVMVFAPAIALLYDRTFLAGAFREALRRRYGLYLALAATWLPLAWLVSATAGRGGTAGFGQGIDGWTYLATQFGAIVHYLRLTVWPSPLVLDYGRVLAHTAAEIVPYAIAVGLLVLATIVALWRWPKAGFLGACFFALLAPSSSIVPVATQTMAEHRMYLPLAAVLAGIVAAACIGLRELVRRDWLAPRLAAVVFGVFIVVGAVACGAMTHQRNKDYRSEIGIWRDTVGKAPTNARAQSNLGLALAASGRLPEAIACYWRALEIEPADAGAYNNLGHAEAALGHFTPSLAYFNKAIALKPTFAEAYNNLGTVLASRGQTDEAIAQFNQALKVRPDYADAHNNLGYALSQRGRWDEALTHLRKVSELRPESADAQDNLGEALATRGRLYEAVERFQAALGIEPQDARAYGGLAHVLYKIGRPQDALTTARRALELAVRQRNTALATELKRRMAQYETKAASPR
ncbi:MAG: tetratricopeptide repeat protein [Thermoguttaceae bacterium]